MSQLSGQVVWGQHSAVHAAKALLLASLADATNQRFQMVGEQAVPLFPPAAVYVAVMREPRSTVSACRPVAEVLTSRLLPELNS